MLAVKNNFVLCVDAILKHPNMNAAILQTYDKVKTFYFHLNILRLINKQGIMHKQTK